MVEAKKISAQVRNNSGCVLHAQEHSIENNDLESLMTTLKDLKSQINQYLTDYVESQVDSVESSISDENIKTTPKRIRRA